MADAADALFYLLDGKPKRLVKIEEGRTLEYVDGVWHETPLLYARATGIGGDALSTPITEEKALAFIASSGG